MKRVLTPPIPPKEFDIAAMSPYIDWEARRQLAMFYPVMDQESEKTTIERLRYGILQRITSGMARIWDEKVEFFHPFTGKWQMYDKDLNTTMLDIRKEFHETMGTEGW